MGQAFTAALSPLPKVSVQYLSGRERGRKEREREIHEEGQQKETEEREEIERGQKERDREKVREEREGDSWRRLRGRDG